MRSLGLDEIDKIGRTIKNCVDKFKKLYSTLYWIYKHDQPQTK